METLSEILTHVTGAPAVAGLVLTAAIVFLTSDWRLSLTALLVQYLLLGAALTASIQVEVALVKALVGVLAVAILYLTARRIQEGKGALDVGPPPQSGPPAGSRRFPRMQVGWAAGPLGLPLRVLAVLLVVLAVVRLFEGYHLALVPADTAFVAVWLGAMGIVGLILSNDPLRVAPALLTILSGFDLVYASLEPSLAVVGFWSALIRLAAVAFAYLAIVRDLGPGPAAPAAIVPAAEPGLPTDTAAEPPSAEQPHPAGSANVEAEP
jgi:hypothetical protein